MQTVGLMAGEILQMQSKLLINSKHQIAKNTVPPQSKTGKGLKYLVNQ